jgi:hypothetical protein
MSEADWKAAGFRVLSHGQRARQGKAFSIRTTLFKYGTARRLLENGALRELRLSERELENAGMACLSVSPLTFAGLIVAQRATAHGHCDPCEPYQCQQG